MQYIFLAISILNMFLNSWLVVQNLKIARSRGFIFPEAFRLTLVKGIVRIKNVELKLKRSQLYILYSDDSLDKCQTKSFGKYETSASEYVFSFQKIWCLEK